MWGMGNMGVNTANLVAIVVVTLLTLLNTFGVKFGAAVQNVFTSAKILALMAVVADWAGGEGMPAAMAANFGSGWHHFWAGAGLGTLHTIAVGSFWPGTHDGTAVVGCADGGSGGAGGVAVFVG